MKRNVTIVLYIVLLGAVVFFGLSFRADFRHSLAPAPGESATNQTPAAATQPNAAGSKNVGQMMTHGALAFIALIALAILASRNVSHFMANRVEKFLFDEDAEGERDPEYEEAEKVWANGKHLEAIQLMREYLKVHPREQYVALRIAEIYEKDLANPLAAALEYEEVIKKRLPAERWGWAAIHLANLYSGPLNKTAQATDLLRRIIDEHPQTSAAKKARERLGEPEPLPQKEPLTETPTDPAVEGTKPAASTLPPGFRPK
jgi:hypothetical protein